MPQIVERRVVACPYHLAQGYPATLTLSLPGAELVNEAIARDEKSKAGAS